MIGAYITKSKRFLSSRDFSRPIAASLILWIAAGIHHWLAQSFSQAQSITHEPIVLLTGMLALLGLRSTAVQELGVGVLLVWLVCAEPKGPPSVAFLLWTSVIYVALTAAFGVVPQRAALAQELPDAQSPNNLVAER